MKYYEQKIEENPNWELAKVYSDAGISGTSITKRIDFKGYLALYKI